MDYVNIKLDFDGRYPIYEQIIQQFFKDIVTGKLKPGDRIPSIRDLAMQLKVNTNTIQRSYQEMERNSIIYSKRGMGYFVMENDNMVTEIRKDMINSHLRNFVEEMQSIGFSQNQILQELEDYLKQGGKS